MYLKVKEPTTQIFKSEWHSRTKKRIDKDNKIREIDRIMQIQEESSVLI